MKVIDTIRKMDVTNLDAAFLQAKQFSQYDGHENIKKDWLMLYHQFRSLKGYKNDFNATYNKFKSKKERGETDFNLCYNDGRAANLNFCGAGNMSKSSSNYRTRHRDKIGNLAIESVKNKLIDKILNFCNDTPMLNGKSILIIMDELDRNKYLSDSYDYYNDENSLIILHANLLLWVNKYAPKYVTDYVGNCIGKRWVASLN